MRIAISTCSMVSHDKDLAGTGLGVYMKNLIASLQEENSKDEFFIFMPECHRPIFDIYKRNFNPVYLKNYTDRLLPGLLWYLFVLPVLLRSYKVDCLHIPDFRRFPLIKVCSIVLTIHDMTNFILKDRLTKTRKIYKNLLRYVFARYADRIIAVSENTKKDIVKVLGVAPEKISVIHNGVSEEFRPREKRMSLDMLRNFNPPLNSILYVSRLEHPLKNHVALLKAFSICKKKYNIPHKLIFIGEKWSGSENIFEEIKTLGLQEEAVSLEKIPFEFLPHFYNIADLFVFPSLYEGFGLPAIEAMSSGLPIIASRTSSLRDVVNDAGLLFDPQDVEGLARMIMSVLNDEKLRADMTRKGLDRATQFSWRSAARSVINSYKKASMQE